MDSDAYLSKARYVEFAGLGLNRRPPWLVNDPLGPWKRPRSEALDLA